MIPKQNFKTNSLSSTVSSTGLFINTLGTQHTKRGFISRKFKQPRRRRQQECNKFAYLTKKINSFARFARTFFIFGHLANFLVLSATLRLGEVIYCYMTYHLFK